MHVIVLSISLKSDFEGLYYLTFPDPADVRVLFPLWPYTTAPEDCDKPSVVYPLNISEEKKINSWSNHGGKGHSNFGSGDWWDNNLLIFPLVKLSTICLPVCGSSVFCERTDIAAMFNTFHICNTSCTYVSLHMHVHKIWHMHIIITLLRWHMPLTSVI